MTTEGHCVYSVEWHDAASEDLWANVRSGDVARDLVQVAKEALDSPPSEDGGPLGHYLWRRGITPQRREELDAAAVRGEELDAAEQAWDYVLVYKRRGVSRSGFQVLAVVTTGQLAAGLDFLAPLDFLPEG